MGKNSVAREKPLDNLGEGYMTAARLIYRKIFGKECLVMVYVLSKDGQPLMPTNRHGKVRHLLNAGEAKVVKRCPFTIQLLYESTTYTQDSVEDSLLQALVVNGTQYGTVGALFY